MFEYLLYKKSKNALEKEAKKRAKRTDSAVSTRSLMETICTSLKLEVGSRVPEKDLIDAIFEIRKLNKYQTRTARMWLGRLKKYDHIRKVTYNVCKVMSTGKSWWE